MKKLFLKKISLSFLAAWILTGCVAGVPDYEGDCKKYLLNHDYSQDVVDAFLKHAPLDTNVIAETIRAPNDGVRVVLAMNPHLTFDERQVLWDDNQYVRNALAKNLRLSEAEIAMVITEQHYFVLPGLASNPAVPHETLIQVYNKLKEQGRAGLQYFVMNPNCPQEIISEIMDKSNDGVPFMDQNRDFLRRTMERKEEFRQAKANGNPFPEGRYYPWGHADLWWRD